MVFLLRLGGGKPAFASMVPLNVVWFVVNVPFLVLVF